MLIPLTLPPPVREFLQDGLQLLITRLAALTEEFRAGLIGAIARTLADGAEHLIDRVIPQRMQRADRVEYESEVDYGDEPETNFVDTQEESMSYSPNPQQSQTENPLAMPMTRALIAAGLNVLGVWLLRVGLIPTSAVIAVFCGIMLMFRK